MAIRYFHNSDYNIDINAIQLQEFFQNNQNLQRAEKLAQEEISYYLTQRFDLTQEFTNTGSYSITQQYNVADRVIIDYGTFTSSQTYHYGDSVINDGIGYICITSSVGATTSLNPGAWANVGIQNQIYNIDYPAPLFDSTKLYNLNDVVYWKGFTWSCQSPSTVLNYSQQAQYLYLQYVPGPNVFPDDTQLNSNYQYWLPGSTQSYVVPIGTLPTNTAYWSDTDNRCQQILNWGMDMVLYYLERTIAPRNIPDHRVSFYKHALKMLDAVGDGSYTINALARQSGAGTMFRFGGPTPDSYNGW